MMMQVYTTDIKFILMHRLYTVMEIKTVVSVETNRICSIGQKKQEINIHRTFDKSEKAIQLFFKKKKKPRNATDILLPSSSDTSLMTSYN
jgi:hypothetical protein